MQLSPHLVGPTMMVVCAAMVLAAAAIYWSTALGSAWTVPRAAVRAVLQLVAVAAILATALSNLRTSLVVLGIMFVAATVTAARRSRSNSNGPNVSRANARDSTSSAQPSATVRSTATLPRRA